MDAGWVQDRCRIGAAWVQDGWRMEGGWMEDGCKMGAGWMQDGCRMDARWVQDGSKFRYQFKFGRYALHMYFGEFKSPESFLRLRQSTEHLNAGACNPTHAWQLVNTLLQNHPEYILAYNMYLKFILQPRTPLKADKQVPYWLQYSDTGE